MNVLKKFSFWLMVSLTLVMTVSCKSKKKVSVEQEVVVEETIVVKKPKKDKKTDLRDKIVKESLTWIGTPYGFGHSEKGESTDCSGLVIMVFDEVAGIKLPRNSAQQADYCDKIGEHEVKPGDLVFFATGKDRKKVSHVGIMIDKKSFVHSSGSKGVIISEMTTPYYKRTFIKYGRVIK